MHSTPSTAPDFTVGVDVSKARLDAHVKPNGALRSFDNDKCGRRALRHWALRKGAGRAALEPTWRFHRALHKCLADAGIEVIVVSPRRTRTFARPIGKEAKNDLTDAEVLAVFARLQLAEAAEPRAGTLPGPSGRPFTAEAFEGALPAIIIRRIVIADRGLVRQQERQARTREEALAAGPSTQGRLRVRMGRSPASAQDHPREAGSIGPVAARRRP